MTKVTYKDRRFSIAFVEECKIQNQLPESECDYAPTIEGVLPCPESRRPKKTRGNLRAPVSYAEELFIESVPKFNEVHPRRDVGSMQSVKSGRHSAAQPNESNKPQESIFMPMDEVAYFAHSGEPVPQHTPSGRHVKPFNPPMHELPREPKRVTQTQLRGLNANAVHIDEEGFLKEGPKQKVKGFGQLRDLLGKG